MSRVMGLSGFFKCSAKKALLFGLSTLILYFFSGCYLFPEEEKVLAPPLVKPSTITYETISAEVGDLERLIVARGTFVSIAQSDLYFKNREGRLKAVHVKMGDEVKKGDLLLELETGNLEKQIERQKLYYKKAQLSYAQAENRNTDRYDMEKMAIDLELSRMDLENLIDEINESKLIADIDGKVVYVEQLREGDYIQTYKTLVRIADPNHIQLEYVGDDSEFFKIGMPVEVKFGSEVYEGVVVMTPDTVPDDADERLKKTVRIQVDHLSEDIRVGAIANITLVLDRRENVVILPKSMVHEYSGRYFVYVLENGLKKERDVELGLETATQVEIVKGLKEGEQVITR